MSDNRIWDKLDEISKRLDSIDLTLIVQSSELKEHTRRSTANEETLDIVRKDADDRLKSLESHKDKVLGAIALLGIIFSLVLGLKTLGLF